MTLPIDTKILPRKPLGDFDTRVLREQVELASSNPSHDVCHEMACCLEELPLCAELAIRARGQMHVIAELMAIAFHAGRTYAFLETVALLSEPPDSPPPIRASHRYCHALRKRPPLSTFAHSAGYATLSEAELTALSRLTSQPDTTPVFGDGDHDSPDLLDPAYLSSFQKALDAEVERANQRLTETQP
jgi:hypothetical protein